jgi:translation initiation factor IF-3
LPAAGGWIAFQLNVNKKEYIDLPTHTIQGRMRRQLLLSLNFTRSNPPRYTGEHPPMYAVARHLSSPAQKAKAYSPSHAKNKPTKKAEVSLTPSTQSSSKNKQPLCNEDLIRCLLSQKPSSTVDTVQIRLVLDASLLQQAPLTNSNNNNISKNPSPATVQVISLSTAIQLASQYEVDLLAINMEQDPPVIKAVNVQKLLYKESKTSTGSSSSNAGSSSNQQKAVKEFQFKTCIGDHDLHRKVENMIAYLKKGHACQVMIQLNKRFAKKNTTEHTNTVGEGSEGELDAQGQVIVVESPAARQNRFILEEMMNKLRLLIGTTGQTQGNPKLNEERTRCSLYYQPVSKR